MKNRKLASAVVIIGLSLVGLSSTAWADTITLNGSLEDLNSSFVNTAQNYMSLAAGSSAIASWTVSSGSVGAIVWAKSPTGDGHNASAGTFFVDLTGFGNSSPNGAIEQMLLNMVVGQSYSFSIDTKVEGLLPLVSVGAAGIALTPGTPFTVGSDIWTPQTGSFVATSSSALLKIANQSATQQITFIDNINVTGPRSAVPEPSTMALTLTGSALIALLRRRQPHA